MLRAWLDRRSTGKRSYSAFGHVPPLRERYPIVVTAQLLSTCVSWVRDAIGEGCSPSGVDCRSR
eukprot:5795147-Prymnesium_polylepis.1